MAGDHAKPVTLSEDTEIQVCIDAVRLVPLSWCLWTRPKGNSILIVFCESQSLTFLEKTELASTRELMSDN